MGRVDVSDGEPTTLSAPSSALQALHTKLSCSSLFVAGSPAHKAPQYFTGHIAALSLSPLSQLPPHPLQPHNTRLPPLPTRSLPLHSFAALLSTQPFSPLTITPHIFPTRSPSTHPPVIACHDMRGGYTDDFHCQSIAHSAQTTAYAFQHWAHIDTLIYFSHARITVPPSAHITARHTRTVCECSVQSSQSGSEGVARDGRVGDARRVVRSTQRRWCDCASTTALTAG